MQANWKETVAKKFGAQAPQYESHSHIQAITAKDLVEHIPDTPCTKILEIGCGTGSLSRHIRRKYPNAQLHITDLSPEMLKQARKNLKETDEKAKNTYFYVMDAESHNVTEKFDLIISNMAFQWFENPEISITNLENLLYEGATLYYSVPGPNSFKEWTSTLKALSLPSGLLPFKDFPGIYKTKIRTEQFPSTFDFLKSIKNIGASTPQKNYRVLSVSEIKHACQLADRKYNGAITWEILYGKITK